MFSSFFGKGSKEQSNAFGGLLQSFRFALSSVFDQSAIEGKKDDGIKLSEREKQQIKFAQELQAQAETELKNELDHEEKLEMAYEEFAHKKKMLQLKAEEERKQAERKRELAIIKQTVAQLNTKVGMLKMITGGPMDEAFVTQLLTDAENVAKGVLPAEKELMEDITTLVKASMYDKDGNFVGKEGMTKCLAKLEKENPKLFEKVKKNEVYKKLSSENYCGTTEEDFKSFIESNVENVSPSTASVKLYQERLHDLQDEVKENRKKLVLMKVN